MSTDLATERDKMDCAFLRAHAHYLDTAETKWPYVNSARAIGETGRRVADRMEAKDTEIARIQEAKRRALAIADERSKENCALRAALCWGIGAALNELKARDMPLEWSPDGGIGKMLAAMGVTATKMTPEVWDVVQGKVLRHVEQTGDGK